MVALLAPTTNYGCSAAFIAQALPVAAALAAAGEVQRVGAGAGEDQLMPARVMAARGLPAALLSVRTSASCQPRCRPHYGLLFCSVK